MTLRTSLPGSTPASGNSPTGESPWGDDREIHCSHARQRMAELSAIPNGWAPVGLFHSFRSRLDVNLRNAA
jgi:hypothetical protein